MCNQWEIVTKNRAPYNYHASETLYKPLVYSIKLASDLNSDVPISPLSITPVLGDPHWVGGRCWRDFFPFSLSFCDLLGNKFTPCTQAGSVLPVLVLMTGCLPVFLCTPGPFLVFSLPVPLQKARTEQFWWLPAFWWDQCSSGVLSGLWGSPVCGTSQLEDPLLQPQPSGSAQPSTECPHLGPHLWAPLSPWTIQYPSWSSPEFLNIWSPIFRAVLGLHSLFFVVGVLQGWFLREAMEASSMSSRANPWWFQRWRCWMQSSPPQPLDIC